MKNSVFLCVVVFILAFAAVPADSIAADEASPVVLITGANRGLGLEFARQYSDAGWQVIATARKPESAADLNGLGVRVVQLDVTDADSVARLAADLDGQPIDLLINNAGVGEFVPSLNEIDFDSVKWMIDVNTVGPMRVTQAMLPNLSAGQRKTIVNITSGAGSIGRNTSARFYGYRESKAALNMFTKSAAIELRDQDFIVVAMDPGWVQTDMGGPEATFTPEQSISGMRTVIDGLTADDTGTFQHFRGEDRAW